MSSSVQNDLAYAGAVCCLGVSILLLGPIVHEFRVWWMALRGEKAKGHVERLSVVKHDKYGDPTQWSVSAMFPIIETGGKRSVATVQERLGIQYAPRQEVVVRYDPNRPHSWATLRRPQDIFAKASGILTLTVVMFLTSAGLVFHWF